MSYTAEFGKDLCATCRDSEDCSELKNLDKVIDLNGLEAKYIITKCSYYRDKSDEEELPIFSDLK